MKALLLTTVLLCSSCETLGGPQQPPPPIEEVFDAEGVEMIEEARATLEGPALEEFEAWIFAQRVEAAPEEPESPLNDLLLGGLALLIPGAGAFLANDRARRHMKKGIGHLFRGRVGQALKSGFATVGLGSGNLNDALTSAAHAAHKQGDEEAVNMLTALHTHLEARKHRPS